MSERTFKIADAILDSAIEEYRNINLANEEAVEQYAFEAMDESITSEEARAILDACNEYLALIESPDFDGEGQKAFDHIIGALKDFRLSHGGQRIGAGRKNAGTKAVLVRLTDEQHETLKNLGGSSWLQKEMDDVRERDLKERKIVIDIGFERIRLMSEDDLKAWKESEGPDRWEICGPYECYDVDDAFCLLTDHLECALNEEQNGGEIDIDKVKNISDCLNELRDFVRFGKEF